VLRYLARRLLLAVPTLFGVLAVTFLLLFVAPGDPVQEMVGERADAATIARLRRELRLDDPLPTQFAAYAGGVLRGDLGRSFITGRPIARDVAERFPKTLLLAGTAMLFASAAGIALGVVSARRPGGWADRLALGGAYLGISFPVYWVGLLLIVFFAVQLRWLPASGYAPGARGLRYLVLPALALGTRSVAFLARVTRSAMLEVLGSDYVRTARAKGLAERAVVFRHGLRNALIPVVTVLGLDFGYYLTGSILTETIFSWPGIGRYVVNAISRRDLPAIQGSVLFSVRCSCS
jgi:ABC-type dipeptide/oligopeptide/nickel transport system permease component